MSRRERCCTDPVHPHRRAIAATGPDFATFRNDLGNYIDCFHVNASGAAKIDAYLTQHIPQALTATN